MPNDPTENTQDTKGWRDFTNYQKVLDFQDRRPEVARSRMTAWDCKHRARVHTKAPRRTNRATRRIHKYDPDTGARYRGHRGTHTADIATWAAEKKADSQRENAARRGKATRERDL